MADLGRNLVIQAGRGPSANYSPRQTSRPPAPSPARGNKKAPAIGEGGLSKIISGPGKSEHVSNRLGAAGGPNKRGGLPEGARRKNQGKRRNGYRGKTLYLIVTWGGGHGCLEMSGGDRGSFGTRMVPSVADSEPCQLRGKSTELAEEVGRETVERVGERRLL